VHIDPKALSASLEGLGSTDIGGIPVEAALERVMGAARGLFAVSGVGLMLVDNGGSLRYVLGSDPAAQALEQAQEDLVEGPCVDSFVLAQYVRTDDLITDARWPRLGARLAGAGVRAVLGDPTRLGGVPAGSLNV
jgi:GAF domain-containing protein